MNAIIQSVNAEWHLAGPARELSPSLAYGPGLPIYGNQRCYGHGRYKVGIYEHHLLLGDGVLALGEALHTLPCLRTFEGQLVRTPVRVQQTVSLRVGTHAVQTLEGKVGGTAAD